MRNTPLDAALAAARWIRTTRLETRDGIAWPCEAARGESAGTDLYHGAPGVIVFFLDVFHATGDRRFLDEAKLGADELSARIPAMEEAGDSGLYYGLSGVAFVLEELHRAGGGPRYREAAERAIAAIHAKARRAGTGEHWSSGGEVNDVISGTAGVGLLLLWAAERTKDPESLAHAAAAGRRLLDLGMPAQGGVQWAASLYDPHRYPNFAHGTAGISTFLSRLFRATRERAFLDGALAGARYLEAVADQAGSGFRLFHHEPRGKELFYLGWCHGPAGTARLFLELWEATRDPRWSELARAAGRTVLESGVPERRLPGLWNNVGQCCGTAGLGEFLLRLHRVRPDPEYLEAAQRIAADAVTRATPIETPEGDGLNWWHAEHRIRPDLLTAQTGFMQGAAGLGAFFLHLDAALARRDVPWVSWPDS